MKHLLCLTLVATAALISAAGCQRQEKDKPTVNVETTAPEKDKPPVIDNSPKPPGPFTNSIGMKFVWIPPGTFMMGSPKDEDKRGYDETQHEVKLTKGFYMGVHAVTQEHWQTVMDN